VKEIEIIGRPIEGAGGGDSPRPRDWNDLVKRQTLDLCEAAAVSGLRVHQLKRAISAGMLKAEWRGRYYVERGDVDGLVRFLHRLKRNKE
jgi:hypothetical protein